MAYARSVSSFLLLMLATFTLHVLIHSPISPVQLHFPPPSSYPIFTTLYSSFQESVEKLGEGLLKDPEDVMVDEASGLVYAATRDGWIKRMHLNGTWKNWKGPTQGGPLLGIAKSSSGKGLLEVDDEGVNVLGSNVQGKKISFADDVIEASDGSIYFSVASTKFGLHNSYLDVLEAQPHRQVLMCDRSSKQTTILLDDLGFANGVTLSKDQDYLLVCESWKCLKDWPEGVKKGTTEIFVENLPGSPDNINLAPDGSYWIALLRASPDGLQFVHKWRILNLIASFRRLTDMVKDLTSRATVVQVGSDGKLVKVFGDPDGRLVSFVTSAYEFKDHLYLGSLNSNFIGKLPLMTVAA